MSDSDLDKLLPAPAEKPGPDTALIAEIVESLRPGMQPVTPPPHASTLGLALLAGCWMVAILSGAASGLGGLRAQGPIVGSVLLICLLALSAVAARELVSQMTPGSRHLIRPGTLCTIAAATLLLIYGTLFHDYGADHFLNAGLKCLSTGLLVALTAALLCGALLWRGLAGDGSRAGLTLGTLAGLIGIAMLTLHCPALQVSHLLWHVLVLGVSGFVGMMIGSRRVPRVLG